MGLKYYKKIPHDILKYLDELTSKAKEQIDFLKFKQNSLKFLNKKYKGVLDYLKKDKDYKIDANNVLAVKSILGILTRVQMDCVLSTFACLLSKNPNKFAEKYLNGTLKLSYMEDANNNTFSESKLCKRLEDVKLEL